MKPKEESKTPVVLDKKKPGRKKKEQSVKFHITNEQVILVFN